MNRPSFRQAVDAKCRDCIWDPAESGTWRQQVEACRSEDCALWSLRPRATSRNPSEVRDTPSEPQS
jgi:hypothetical protein